MKFGLGIPTSSEGYYYKPGFVDEFKLINLCKLAESWGYESAWFNERFNITAKQLLPWTSNPNFFEAIMTMSYIAAVTQKIHLVTGILQPILRDPLLLANQLGTLDRFSHGRIILGLGIGANRTELVNLKPALYNAHRGNIINEFLDVFPLLISQDTVSFKGNYYQYDNVSSTPKPLSPLKIYLAGRGINTLRRLAHSCSGWILPISTSPNEVIQRKHELSPFLDKEQRSIDEINLIGFTILSLDRDSEKAKQRFLKSRMLEFTGSKTPDEFINIAAIGTPEEVIEKIIKLKESGETSLIVNKVPASEFEEIEEQFQMFAEEVIPFI